MGRVLNVRGDITDVTPYRLGVRVGEQQANGEGGTRYNSEMDCVSLKRALESAKAAALAAGE